MNPNAANIELNSNITLILAAEQPGGRCWAGYTWYPAYGGCRRQVLEQQTESRACPSGYSGQETRTNNRYNYILQATGHVSNGPWTYGAWNNHTCSPTGRITPPDAIPKSIQIDVAHGTNFGANAFFYAYLMLHRSTGILWCYATIESTESGKTVYEYPKEGIFYSQSYPSQQMHQCQIRGDTVDFGGINTGYGTITRTAVSNDGCTHYFNRTGTYGPYPTPFSNTVRAC